MVPTDVTFIIYGWTAALSAAATIAALVSGTSFFSGAKWIGKLNDIFSVLQALLMIPLVFFFNQLATPPSFLALFVSSAFGLGGMLVSAYGQLGLMANKISFEESQRFFPAGGAIGFWLIMVNISMIGARTLPSVLIWIGIAAGVGYLLIVGGFIKGGQRDPIFYGGSFLMGICYPAWGFWLGKIILESLIQ